MTTTRVEQCALLALTLAVVACGSEPIDEAPSPPADAPSRETKALAPCEVVFTPEAPLVAEVTAATARWSKATGCNIRVGEGGIRVRLVAELFNELGNPRPGVTHWLETGELVIDVTDLRIEPVIPHEIGHVLYPHPGHVEDGIGLMCSDGGAWRITAADLEYVCAGFACQAFVPEV